ncbi:MAG: hypothetical protein ACF8AM_16685 [Rhodopirellula sp. JB055]|uniref:hypothetical protein n=1 Tax=Rhodopirellula sp. JB055 TaxID=3342846 RepID=UPI00370B7588
MSLRVNSLTIEMTFRLLFFSFCSCSPVLAQRALLPADVQLLFKNSAARSEYTNKEYRYEVTCSGEFGEHQELRTFRVAAPRKGSILYPLFLSCSIDNPGEPHIDSSRVVRAWQGFDGERSRHFRRSFVSKVVLDRDSQVENILLTYGGFAVSDIVEDPFISHLLTGLGGVQAFSPQESTAEPDIDLPPILTTPVNGFAGVTEAFQLEIANDESWRLIMSQGPEFLCLFEQIENDDLRERYEVTDTSYINGVLYPSKGQFTKTIGSRDWFFTYELVSVTELKDFNSWFPAEVPEGTYVENLVTGKVRRVPYNDEAQELINLYVGGARGVAPAGSSNWSFAAPFFLVANLTIVFGIAWLLWRSKGRGDDA